MTGEEIIQLGKACKSIHFEIPLCVDWETRKYCDRKLCCTVCPQLYGCDIVCDELAKILYKI